MAFLPCLVRKLQVKAIVQLNWVDYAVECTPAELDTFNSILSKMRKVVDDARNTEDRALLVMLERPEVRILLLPAHATINLQPIKE